MEVRNGSGNVLKQQVWGQRYVDELVQVKVNSDPTADDTCDTRYWVCQDANYNVLGVIDAISKLVERYEYTPYGERTVFFSPGANDPDLMAPTSMSRRIPFAGGVNQPYGLNEFGHQGLHHDEELGLVYNRARSLHSTLGRFMQRDPLGYVDGMGLYEGLRSAPTSRVDPTGRISIGKKIIATLGWRMARCFNNGIADAIFGATYEFDDDENEMPFGSVGHSMNDFYERFLEAQDLPSGIWQPVNIPFQSAKQLVGQFTKPSTGFGSTGWWLNGAHDVRVHGSLEACRSGEKYYVRGLSASWQWHDEIDAKSYYRMGKDGENAIATIVEGTWDWYMDKIRDTDFYVIVHWNEQVPTAVFPPGPLR